MRKAHYVLSLALLLAASLYLLPALQAANEPTADSPEVSELLTQAKTHANRLAVDADHMKTFGMTNLSWESHSTQVSIIKDHVNNLGKVLQQMSDSRHLASPWQRDAIDRITPLAQEMATNIESTIEHINNNQSRLHMPEFKDYLDANYEVASELSTLIGDYVAYGKNKAKYERLGGTLKAPGH